MAEDYYSTLEVSRTATPEEIQKSYRNLARKYHPDLNPDDKKAKAKFQQVQKAFETLNDEKKRKLYDQFGADYEQMAAGGGPRPGGPGGQSWGGGGGGGQMPEGFEGIDLSSLFGGGGGGGFGDIFGQFGGGGGGAAGGGRKRGRTPMTAGADLHRDQVIPFTTAILGGSIDLNILRASGKNDTLAVKIPPGIADGGKIRLRNQGEPGTGGGPNGDLLLTIRVAPHPFFTRHEDHLEVRVPITLAEAINGAKVDVPTPQGTITLKVPAGSSSGTRLRVRGRGIKHTDGASGDLYAVLMIVLPDPIPPELKEAVEKLPEQQPRAELKW
jgi:DnaJ-class molecular chaperone